MKWLENCRPHILVLRYSTNETPMIDVLVEVIPSLGMVSLFHHVYYCCFGKGYQQTGYTWKRNMLWWLCTNADEWRIAPGLQATGFSFPVDLDLNLNLNFSQALAFGVWVRRKWLISWRPSSRSPLVLSFPPWIPWPRSPSSLRLTWIPSLTCWSLESPFSMTPSPSSSRRKYFKTKSAVV